jgi:hypothetical protein
VLDRKFLSGMSDQLPNQIIHGYGLSISHVKEGKPGFLIFYRQVNTADQVGNIEEITGSLAIPPDNYFSILSSYYFGHGRAKNVRSFQIKLVVRPVNIRMAQDRISGCPETGIEFAHLFYVNFCPPDAEIIIVDFLIGIKVIFFPRTVAGWIHYCATEKNNMADPAIVGGPEDQGIHHGVIRHVVIGPVHNIFYPGSSRGGLDDDIFPRHCLPDVSRVREVDSLHYYPGIGDRPGIAVSSVELDPRPGNPFFHQIAPDESGRAADKYFFIFHRKYPSNKS